MFALSQSHTRDWQKQNSDTGQANIQNTAGNITDLSLKTIE